MDITNKSGKPLSVPLPGGKKLFLGPGKTGQVSPKALTKPALAALIESGDIVTFAGGKKRIENGSSGSPSARTVGSTSHKTTGAMRQSGDR